MLIFTSGVMLSILPIILEAIMVCIVGMRVEVALTMHVCALENESILHSLRLAGGRERERAKSGV